MKSACYSLVLIAVCSGTSHGQAETIAPSEFEVADGFEVTIWATTPQLYNPTNFDVDSQGRLWVTEAVNYRNFRNEPLGLKQEEGDRVVVLEDTDRDGRADASHTFVRDADLVAPLGIGVIGNKIIVSCAPNILIYTDVDGDTVFDPKIDTKEVFLTGFRGLDHDHSLHSVKVGPDGNWYFNVGNAGAHTVTDKSGWTLRAGSSYAGGTPHLKDNTPGRRSDDGRVWVGGVGLRIRPDGTGLTPIGHNFRNAYEEAVTSFGDVFHADNDDPPACRTTWLMEYGNAGFASADGSRGWKIDQRPLQPVSVAEWRQEDPGTIPAGDVYGYGAPTGVAFGENGCFESQYPQGLLLVCESARGEVFSYSPQPQGAGFTLERSLFLKLKAGSTKQGWFRPSDVVVGVDGALYVSDWYDPGVGGHRMSDTTGSGTIYRIAPKDFRPDISPVDLSTPEGQVAALLSPAVNVRALGWSALRTSGEAAFPAINGLLENSNPLLAARGIWLLPYFGEAGLNRLTQLLEQKEAQVRLTAFRAIRRAADDPSMHKELSPLLDEAREMLCEDASPAVRREVAISLRDIPWEERQDWFQRLAKGFDGWDRWYLEALGIASDGHAADAYRMLVEKSELEPVNWDRRVAALAWRLHPPAAIDGLTQRVMTASIPLTERQRMLTALAFIKDRRAAENMLIIANTGPKDIRGMAAWWGKNRDTNDWKEFGLGDQFPEPPELVKPQKWSTPRLDFTLAGKPVWESSEDSVDIDLDVRGAKRLYLVAERIAPVSKKKPKAKGQKTPEHKAVGAVWNNPVLTSGSDEISLTSLPWIMAFSNGQTFEQGQDGKQPEWDRRIRLTQPVLTGHTADEKEAASIRVQTRSVLVYDLSEQPYQRFLAQARISSADRKGGERVRFRVYLDRSSSGDELPAAAELAGLAGEASHGRALYFSKRLGCVNCHSAAGFGGGVGPDLTQIAKKHAPLVLVEGIVNPSAAISTGFEPMTVVTVQGKVINGLIVSGGDPVVLKDSTGKHFTIPRDEVELMQASKVSIMPDIKTKLTVEEIAALVSFLKAMEMQ